MPSDLTSRTALELGRAKVRQSGRLTKGAYDEAKHPRGYHGHWLVVAQHHLEKADKATKSEDMHESHQYARDALRKKDFHGAAREIHGAMFPEMMGGRQNHRAEVHQSEAIRALHLHADALKAKDSGKKVRTKLMDGGVVEHSPNGEHKVIKEGLDGPLPEGPKRTGGRGSSRGRLGGDLGETHAAENAAREHGDSLYRQAVAVHTRDSNPQGLRQELRRHSLEDLKAVSRSADVRRGLPTDKHAELVHTVAEQLINVHRKRGKR